MTRNGGRNYNGGNHSGRGENGGGGERGRGQGGGGRGGARARGPPQQGQNQGGGGAYRPPAPLQQVQGIGVGLTSGEWSGQPWSASSVAGQSSSQPVSRKLPEQALPDIKGLEISEKKPSSSIPGGSSEKEIDPIKRPDNGGTLAFRNIWLLANHFPVKFNPQSIIMHYDVDMKPNMPPGSLAAKRTISKSDLRLITDKLFSSDPTRFPEQISTYDGEKNIFSAVPLRTGTFYVELSGGEDTRLALIDLLLTMDLANDDLGYGIAASRGFQQSLKATAQGPALCLDSSVLPFRKQLPVLGFLTEQGFQLKDVSTSRREVMREVMHVLKGLKVHVTHRLTNQKYTIAGFSDQNTQDITFTLEDREGENPPREISLGEYFRERYNREPRYQDMPCVDLGKGNRKNYVPMEFCVLVEGQRYPKEHLYRDQALSLKQISLAHPRERMDTISGMVRSEDGPCGDVSQNFEIEVEKNMTRVLGRVIEPPDLKLVNLRNRCRNMGIRVEEPVVRRFTNMNEFSCIAAIQKLLHNVVEGASQKNKGQLQLIVCVMSARHDGYKYLKWVSETQIGVLTQCCLVGNANKGNDQYLANLALKINGKIGGSNVELNGPLPGFEGDEHVMFVGADVNHPKGEDCRSCPSIAAVVASVNWPAANRYIVDFGAMCLDLVNSYAKLNKVKPKKIVVFRDGVSEGQFDMVLNEEHLKNAIYEGNYRPTITLTVAQKRHPTCLFLENERDGGASGNVPPGTVVDTTIVHPFQFDFYLCSHYGNLGTSKPTHYYCLFDENKFTLISCRSSYTTCVTPLLDAPSLSRSSLRFPMLTLLRTEDICIKRLSWSFSHLLQFHLHHRRHLLLLHSMRGSMLCTRTSRIPCFSFEA
ncbi:unnamed protein product [Camellia sinensis]